ncbi:hypothetical protein KUCAC02_017832 [Chaenocephalus aceratus]|uniref:Uncharacterized protein n=1 Tax=Chaenocephalus aceratus TaxID=36190 RepID=A0ACB9W358_CHAAC|nr:hypothetical protein KUCAC02_017832 [Chaenocephalus aceratus]
MGTDALFVRVQRRHPCALLIRCILVQAAWADPNISDNKTSRFGAPCFLSNHSASGNTEQRPGGISGTQFIERDSAMPEDGACKHRPGEDCELLSDHSHV